MTVLPTALEGVVMIEPAVFRDRRGTFSETFSERDFNTMVAPVAGVAPVRFVQDNESVSRRGVVRGLHFQKEPHGQAKLVRAVSGRILDVAIDMRRRSATFGRWVAVELSAENRRQLFIPRGFAHGFGVLDNEAVVAYRCDNYYAPESEAGVLWCDPALAIDWGVDQRAAVVSEKDAALPLFANAYSYE